MPGGKSGIALMAPSINVLERRVLLPQLGIVRNHVRHAGCVSKEVENQRLLFVMRREVRDVSHDWIGQVQQSALDKHHRCHVGDRFCDRCQQKHSVPANLYQLLVRRPACRRTSVRQSFRFGRRQPLHRAPVESEPVVHLRSKLIGGIESALGRGQFRSGLAMGRCGMDEFLSDSG